MSSDFSSNDVERGQNVTDPYAQLGHNMYDEKKVKYHTQVDKPDPTTLLDVYADYAETALCSKVGKILHSYASWKRDNMVAFKRERAKETERMVRGQAEEDRKKKELQDILLKVQR